MDLYQIIKKPLLTEKTSGLTDNFNKYTFEVDLRANKNHIKVAVESLFNVKVLSIRTSIRPGKPKRSSKGVRKTSKSKKATVEIKEGQKLDLFKGI